MTIDFDSLNVFQKFPSFVPWFNTDKGVYAVIIQPAIEKKKKTSSNDEFLKNAATDALMEYYLPEFYPFIYNKEKEAARTKVSTRGKKVAKNKASNRAKQTAARTINTGTSTSGVKSSYKTIRKAILDNLQYIKSDQGPADDARAAPIAPKYLYNTAPGTINFKRIREGLRTYDPQAQAKAQAATAVLQGSATGEVCLLPGETPPVPSYSSGFPPYEEARQVFLNQQFNARELRPGPSAQILLGITGRTMRDLSEALEAYHQQIIRYPSPLKIPLDLEAINVEIRRVVASLVANVRRDLNLSGKEPYLSPDDILRIQMNQDQKILGASYELETSDGLEVAPLKIGLFSLIKYNRSVKDPWLMQTLINHERIIRTFNENSAGSPGLPSLLNFIQDTYGELIRTAKPIQPVKIEPDRPAADGPPGSIDVSFTAPPPPGVDPKLFNSIFQASESSMKLDVSNPTSLATTLSTFLRSEEMAALEVALNDPDTQAALMLENASKTFDAKFPIKKVIEGIIDMINEAKGIKTAVDDRRELENKVTDAEEALVTAQAAGDGLAIEDAQRDLDRAQADVTRDRTSSREGGGAKQVRDTLEIMDEVLARFGILELISEALVCLTMGSNFSLSRIKDAISQGLDIAEMIEDYEPPKIPKPLLKMPEFPEIKIPNPITGDPPLWKQILDMLLEILMELAMDLIMGLVEMIKLNCNNLLDRPEQLGSLDAGQAMKDNLKGGPIINPNLEDLLDNAFGQFQLDQERGFAYLSAVSEVLSPMEICRLFNSRPDVQESTIEKIAIFNTTWPEETISVLQSRNQVLSFFSILSPLTNMVTICNDLVNDQDLRVAVENYCLNEADFSTLADQESIKKLASLLNDGLPIDPASLLPNLLCPDHPQYLANPVIDRIIPSIFNTTVDNVKMQFVYSVEASRTAMLEPKVVAGVGNDGANKAVNEALKDLCVRGKVGDDCVEPPEVNTKFLSILADIFEDISNVGLNIDPEICPDVDLDKVGNLLDPGMLEILNDIISDALEAGGDAQQALADANNQIGEIKDTMNDSGGAPPSVTYVFSRRFYNNYMTMARQSPPEYIDTNGNAKPNDVWRTKTTSPGDQRTFSSYVKQDRSNDEYGRLRMQYHFLRQVKPSIDPLNLEFYSNEDIMSGRPPFRVRIPSGLVPGVEQTWLEGVAENDSFTPLYGSDTSPEGVLGDFGSESGFNPYIFNFTYPLQQQLIGLADNPLSAANKRYLQNKLQKQVFPTVLNGMIKRTFGYIQKNGIFSLSALNSLNLFKDNTNCDPAQTGDLLDIRGILEQIKQEFGEAACSDEGDAKDIAAAALKLGLIYLFIQVYIVEFLVKNLFVISAFKFEEVFEKPLFRELFLTSMVNQIEKKLARSVGGLERFVFDRFEKKLQRSKYQEAGGITHSYAPNTVVSFLKTGTDIKEVPFKKLVQYMIEERMGFTYEVCGQMVNTVQTINNVLSVAGSDRNFEDIFIKDILGIYKSPYGRGGAAMKSGEGRIFFTKYAYWDGISNWGSLSASEILVPWNSRELLAAQSTWDAGFIASTPDYVSAGSPYGGIQVWYEGRVGERPTADLPRHILSLQEILGSAQGGAMPVSTGTAVDFLDMLELTQGTLPVFENLKVGYKLMFNFPHYRGAEYKENDWDQSDSPFVQSFKPGPTRDLMIKAMALQGRAVGKDSILDSAQVDLDSSNPGAQILGDLLTVDIYSMGDFNPNNLEAANQSGESADATLQKVKRFNRTTPTNHISRIKEDEEYSRFITQTFNPEMIMMIPILYNLGLTNTFFTKIEENFDTTKYVILDLFGMLSRTNQAPPIASPETSNSTALANSIGSAGDSDLGMSAREFILKMLRETPIKILKGLAELIDPHVAIWKIVRDITGQVFSYVIDIIDTGIDVAEAVQPEGSPIKPMLKNMDGELLLALGFCGLNTMNADATAELPGRLQGDEAPSLGPKMTVRGVDFTGTIVGLFCMPPSPLGIIYLLLMLLEEGDNDEADSDGTGNSQQNAADGQSSNVC